MIDAVDRAIIVASQAGLPLAVDPYAALAERLGLAPQELLNRLQAMQEKGIIRRIAVVPNHYALGYTQNGMSVWDVPDEDVDRLGETISQLPFVTHCYRRPRHLPHWPYNLFAMVHGRSRDDVLHQVHLIRDALGEAVRGGEVLFSTRILKKTGLRLKEAAACLD